MNQTTSNKQSDFDYFIEHLKQYDCKKKPKFFKRAVFNGVDVYVQLDESGRVIRFNITKLFKALNFATKTASSGASTFVNQNIVDKGWIETFPNKFLDVKGKGTQEYKGLYVDINDIENWLIPINGIHAYRWFIDDDTWFESMGKGWVYLINVPKHRGKTIFKYGRTINMGQRFLIYLNATPSELQALGIDIIAFAYVDNQSEAEDAIAKAFDEANYLSTEDGREYRFIDEEDYLARKTAFGLFYEALEGIGYDTSRIEWFNSGVNTYHQRQSIKSSMT